MSDTSDSGKIVWCFWCRHGLQRVGGPSDVKWKTSSSDLVYIDCPRCGQALCRAYVMSFPRDVPRTAKAGEDR